MNVLLTQYSEISVVIGYESGGGVKEEGGVEGEVSYSVRGNL